jgi:hypothetical protein
VRDKMRVSWLKKIRKKQSSPDCEGLYLLEIPKNYQYVLKSEVFEAFLQGIS